MQSLFRRILSEGPFHCTSPTLCDKAFKRKHLKKLVVVSTSTGTQIFTSYGKSITNYDPKCCWASLVIDESKNQELSWDFKQKREKANANNVKLFCRFDICF